MSAPPDCHEFAISPASRDHVAKVVGIFRSLYHGESLEGTFSQERIAETEYRAVIQQLKNEGLWDYVQNHAHYDYFQKEGYVAFRMPGLRQGLFRLELMDLLFRKIGEIATSYSPGNIATKICRWSMAGPLSFDKMSHAFPFEGLAYPSMDVPVTVIEIDNTSKCMRQQQKIEDVAQALLEKSKGSVGIVLGFHLQAGLYGSKAATISMWKTSTETGGIRTVLKNEHFRFQDGSPADGVMTLTIRDIVGERINLANNTGQNHVLDEVITVSYSDLARLLDLVDLRRTQIRPDGSDNLSENE